MSLFPDRRSAIFSDDRKYRTLLRVVWDDQLPCVAFVALNPSKADEFKDDNTSRKLIGFAKRNGYGSMILVNIFALGATDPRELYTADDPIGPHSDIGAILRQENPLVVVCCWGAHGKLHGRGEIVSAQIQRYFSDARLRCFGYNIDLSPKHPLYLPNDTELVPFPHRAAEWPSEPPKVEGKHRFMAGTCVDCGKPLAPVCVPFEAGAR